MSMAEYMEMYPNSEIMIDRLRVTRGHLKGKTYEEAYGKAAATSLKARKSRITAEQMANPEQILIRKEKCGLAKHYTPERIANMTAAVNRPSYKIKRRQTISEKRRLNIPKKSSQVYQSKPALEFIQLFMLKHGIENKVAYYHNGGKTGYEYSRGIRNINGVWKYAFYDFVSVDEIGNVQFILEINGPWHYSKEDAITNPNKPATPWSDSKTIKESYNWDVSKINTALEISQNVFVFDLETNELKKIVEPLTHILND